MHSFQPLPIGTVARQTGLTVPTVRYYEEVGLLPATPRTEGGQRHFDKAAVRRLTFIRRCRDFGFSLDQVRELVGLVDQPERPCAEVRDIASVHLRAMRSKLLELQELERSLAGFVSSCDTACAGGAAVDCTILEDLALPSDRATVLQPGGCATLESGQAPSAGGCCKSVARDCTSLVLASTPLEDT